VTAAQRCCPWHVPLAGSYQVLLPNHDVHRPPVSGEPLSEVLVFDRSSEEWQVAMGTKFYLYPVHQSLVRR